MTEKAVRVSEAYTLRLWEPVQARKACDAAYDHVKPLLIAGHRLTLTIKPEKRSDIQNRRMWAMLRDVSEQVDWYGKRLTDCEWKDVFTAALKKQKVVPGIDGGFVVCGARTSKMTRGEMSELQELMTAFGSEHDVVFREPGFAIEE